MSAASEIVYAVASRQERAAAQALVRREYAKQEYGSNKEAFAELVAANEQVSSVVFVAKKEDQVVGTVSFFEDGDTGLPMEQIYREEVQGLRLTGKTLAEVGQLAVDRGQVAGIHERLTVLQNLFALILRAAQDAHVSHLCITINPKHERFYEKLSFEPLGPLKHYPAVEAPALAKVVSVQQVAQLNT